MNNGNNRNRISNIFWWNWNKDLANKIEHILSDYKRVLKENEKKDELIERMKRFLLKENKMRDYLDYQESEE